LSHGIPLCPEPFSDFCDVEKKAAISAAKDKYPFAFHLLPFKIGL
jgi:hypothetical protein